MTSQLPGPLRLSAREREALQLIASGMTPAEAATEMGVCTSRVNRCLRYASAKLHSPERPGAVHRAYRLEEISPSESIDDADIVLSAGQHGVLRGLAGGQDLGWIAANIGVRADVVRRVVRELMTLLGAQTQTHLIYCGWEFGLLGPTRRDATSSSIVGALGESPDGTSPGNCLSASRDRTTPGPLRALHLAILLRE
ncbi:LuxR C-terminal-related transcriptional regulator [Streptomyces sp. NPDC094472]|uniref:LuxR C-terminal-related transcriptional regulator n=1 Tax=Streptomyces sp. NPDC094472 TaxID=3155080 RepID=UPI00332AD6F0